MLYTITCQDVPGSTQKRALAKDAHRERLQQLQQQDRLVLAGPHPACDGDETSESGFTGSLIVAKFNTLNDAIRWAQSDPYVEAGVYQSVIVKPFKRVFPKSES